MNHLRPLMLLLLCLALPACGRRSGPVVRETSAMDTYVTISVFDEDLPEKAVNSLIDSAFGEIRRIEAFASDYIDSSEIGRANRRAGTDSLEISAELAALLR
ncbi:MAG TPA: FAD:protein FMN transferase, partial [Bacteroidota bacterium]|nr:FAD:protein FMN transferase [Bacteroidota bacterium]